MATEKLLIDANALKEKLRIMVKWFKGPLCTEQDELAQAVIKKCIGEVDEIEPVDAVEVVHGWWVDRYGGKYANPLYECSECKKKAPYKFEDDSLRIGLWLQDLTDYCPNCGAKMDGDGNGN